ncbi:bifunctional 4-hydroxy-2-oxoglutarate aldolase/2-dehydro-3-deoxy-phosphogluconate aldolase [Sedimentisphaera salicampi]|uniref:bifunctional 4-hydroxy-2-oxoglutarate aldolase/2-dehydro-3-deoxy-phosphogluconate aldolase n=1 Tax=Sedimentisphaera salicampi TaxID=1941349 RepID=UPI000B9A8C64|nr:bifunctional 4-hydroxy-2-oxoglutarate aldolase/2-dehydro-3-deoxy-phosphogluconate aldolase [Sedimentisphaera salicampi]OXU16125.1 KHG/KDPG aldolase [Sedimentisphaera salicampi]
MAKHSRLETLCAMKNIGLVPVFYRPDAETSCGIMRACAEGGARVVEFTNRGDRAIDVFKELAAYRDESLPEMIIGAGSVCDAPTAAMYIAAGADFIVSPILDRETALLCNKRKIPYSPGCGSASEIHQAHELGVEICKIFPGEQVGGPAFAKALKAPMPWAELMPTGGVAPTDKSLEEWFSAGIAAAGIGSKLIKGSFSSKEDYKKLTDKTAEVISKISKIRTKI